MCIRDRRYSVTPVNFNGTLTLHSALDADVENHTRTTNPLVDYGPFGRHLLPDALTADDKTMTCQSTAVNSKLAMACGSVHLLSEAATATRHQANDVDAWIEYDFAAKQGHTITLEKLTVYTDSLDMDKDAMPPFVNEELTALSLIHILVSAGAVQLCHPLDLRWGRDLCQPCNSRYEFQQ